MIETIKDLERIKYNLSTIGGIYGKLGRRDLMERYKEEEKKVSREIFDLKAESKNEDCAHNWKEWEDENCNAQMRCTRCKEIK
jgi:hypothetical protein